MNRYGRAAQQHWQTMRPLQYAQINDPTGFFTRLGETMASQIIELSHSMAGDDTTGETYLQKLGRLRTARLRAEEQILRETLPPSEPTAN
jgi:hypothetical protein